MRRVADPGRRARIAFFAGTGVIGALLAVGPNLELLPALPPALPVRADVQLPARLRTHPRGRVPSGWRCSPRWDSPRCDSARAGAPALLTAAGARAAGGRLPARPPPGTHDAAAVAPGLRAPRARADAGRNDPRAADLARRLLLDLGLPLVRDALPQPADQRLLARHAPRLRRPGLQAALPAGFRRDAPAAVRPAQEPRDPFHRLPRGGLPGENQRVPLPGDGGEPPGLEVSRHRGRLARRSGSSG